MNSRTQNILEAAQIVFARYGVSKTTMSDIAREAGVARQTVYNAFATKNEVLREVVRLEIKRSIAATQEAWAATRSLEERIEAFHQNGPLRWYQVLCSSPEMADLLEGMNDIANEEMQRGEAAWKTLFVKMLNDLGVRSRDPKITIVDLADYIFYTAKNAKYGVQDLESLQRRLQVSKRSVLMMTGV